MIDPDSSIGRHARPANQQHFLLTESDAVVALPGTFTSILEDGMLHESIAVDTVPVNGPFDFTNHSNTVFLVLDGINDVEFMRRISRVLSATDGSMPDLE